MVSKVQLNAMRTSIGQLNKQLNGFETTVQEQLDNVSGDTSYIEPELEQRLRVTLIGMENTYKQYSADCIAANILLQKVCAAMKKAHHSLKGTEALTKEVENIGERLVQIRAKLSHIGPMLDLQRDENALFDRLAMLRRRTFQLQLGLTAVQAINPDECSSVKLSDVTTAVFAMNDELPALRDAEKGCGAVLARISSSEAHVSHPVKIGQLREMMGSLGDLISTAEKVGPVAIQHIQDMTKVVVAREEKAAREVAFPSQFARLQSDLDFLQGRVKQFGRQLQGVDFSFKPSDRVPEAENRKKEMLTLTCTFASLKTSYAKATALHADLLKVAQEVKEGDQKALWQGQLESVEHILASTLVDINEVRALLEKRFIEINLAECNVLGETLFFRYIESVVSNQRVGITTVKEEDRMVAATMVKRLHQLLSNVGKVASLDERQAASLEECRRRFAIYRSQAQRIGLVDDRSLGEVPLFFSNLRVYNLQRFLEDAVDKLVRNSGTISSGEVLGLGHDFAQLYKVLPPELQDRLVLPENLRAALNRDYVAAFNLINKNGKLFNQPEIITALLDGFMDLQRGLNEALIANPAFKPVKMVREPLAASA